MPISLLAALGIASGVINTIGLVPYIRDILRHKTKPERAMWWIYAALFFELFAAQAAAGVRWPLMLTAASVLSAVTVALLSIKYGYGSLHRRDAVSLGIAAAGLVLWQLTKQPVIAILLIIIVDFAGFWLTLVKTWQAPYTETLLSWQCSCLASALSLASVGRWSFSIYAYPAYAFLANVGIVWLIIYRRHAAATAVR